MAAVPEKIGNAVDGAVATAEAVAAVPGKVFDAGAGAIAWLQSVLPKGPPQLRPPPDQLRSAQPAPKKKWGRPMELPKEEPVAAPPKAPPIIDVEAYVPAGVPEEDWERMEAKERESSKKRARRKENQKPKPAAKPPTKAQAQKTKRRLQSLRRRAERQDRTPKLTRRDEHSSLAKSLGVRSLDLFRSFCPHESF